MLATKFVTPASEPGPMLQHLTGANGTNKASQMLCGLSQGFLTKTKKNCHMVHLRFGV